MGQKNSIPGHEVDELHFDLLVVLQSRYLECRCFTERHFAPPIPETALPLGINPLQAVTEGGPIP